MKVLEKDPRQYFLIAKWPLLGIAIIMALTTLLRRSPTPLLGVQNALSWLGVFILLYTSWVAVRKHSFNIKQVAVVGAILSLGTHWSLPIFHRLVEIPTIVVANTAFYAAITAFGGFLAQKFPRRKM